MENPLSFIRIFLRVLNILCACPIRVRQSSTVEITKIRCFICFLVYFTFCFSLWGAWFVFQKETGELITFIEEAKKKFNYSITDFITQGTISTVFTSLVYCYIIYFYRGRKKIKVS